MLSRPVYTGNVWGKTQCLSGQVLLIGNENPKLKYYGGRMSFVYKMMTDQIHHWQELAFSEWKTKPYYQVSYCKSKERWLRENGRGSAVVHGRHTIVSTSLATWHSILEDNNQSRSPRAPYSLPEKVEPKLPLARKRLWVTGKNESWITTVNWACVRREIHFIWPKLYF